MVLRFGEKNRGGDGIGIYQIHGKWETGNVIINFKNKNNINYIRAGPKKFYPRPCPFSKRAYIFTRTLLNFRRDIGPGRPTHEHFYLGQGDPLRSFLFLMCSEGLSSLMRLALKEGLLRGAKVSRRGLEISHLLFTDDCILFGEASDRGQGAKRNSEDVSKMFWPMCKFQ